MLETFYRPEININGFMLNDKIYFQKIVYNKYEFRHARNGFTLIAGE